MSKGTAPLPWPAMRAPIRKRLWLLPPMARAVVPSQPIVRGWDGATVPAVGDASSRRESMTMAMIYKPRYSAIVYYVTILSPIALLPFCS